MSEVPTLPEGRLGIHWPIYLQPLFTTWEANLKNEASSLAFRYAASGMDSYV